MGQEPRAGSLSWEDSLEKEMAAHSSILPWEIPGTEELGGLQSTGSQRVGHDLGTEQQQQNQNYLQVEWNYHYWPILIICG